MAISYSGLYKLNLDEQKILKDILEKNLIKIERSLKNSFDLAVKVKTFNITGKRKRYSIDFNLKYSGKSLSFKPSINHADEWDLSAVVHSSIDGLVRDIQHKFSSDESNFKKKGIRKLLEKFGI